MKTKQEILAELNQIDTNRGILQQELNQIENNERNVQKESYQYLVGKCFKYPSSSNGLYKIKSIKHCGFNTVFCQIITCWQHIISNSEIMHGIDSIEISLEEFESKFDEVYYNLKNN